MLGLLVDMDKENEFSFKKDGFTILVLYFAFCGISMYLYEVESSDSQIILSILLVCVVLTGFLALYTVQCFSHIHLNDSQWHRSIEYIPLAFFMLLTFSLMIIFLVVVLHENSLSLYEALCNVDIIPWCILVALFIIWFIFLGTMIKMMTQHRFFAFNTPNIYAPANTCIYK